MAKTKQRLVKSRNQNGRSTKVKSGGVVRYSHARSKIPPVVAQAASEKAMATSAGIAIQKAVAALAPQDRELFQQLFSLLEEHLGSVEAASLWLVTKSPAFESTPLAAIRKGQANLVLDLLQSQWGSSPIHA